MKYTIALNSAFDGIRLHGTWEDDAEAIGYAELHFHGETWEVVRIEAEE